jgi:hypothetical protein
VATTITRLHFTEFLPVDEGACVRLRCQWDGVLEYEDTHQRRCFADVDGNVLAFTRREIVSLHVGLQKIVPAPDYVDSTSFGCANPVVPGSIPDATKFSE